MKKILLFGALIGIGLASGGCREKAEPNCRALFDKYYETNVRAFMSAIPDADSVTARRMGECAMNKLYEIDSTFVLKDAKELEVFIRSHAAELMECDSIR